MVLIRILSRDRGGVPRIDSIIQLSRVPAIGEKVTALVEGQPLLWHVVDVTHIVEQPLHDYRALIEVDHVPQ